MEETCLAVEWQIKAITLKNCVIFGHGYVEKSMNGIFFHPMKRGETTYGRNYWSKRNVEKFLVPWSWSRHRRSRELVEAKYFKSTYIQGNWVETWSRCVSIRVCTGKFWSWQTATIEDGEVAQVHDSQLKEKFNTSSYSSWWVMAQGDGLPSSLPFLSLRGWFSMLVLQRFAQVFELLNF